MKSSTPNQLEAETLGEEFISLPRRTVVFTMAGVMMAMFLSSLDQTVVGTAMPQIIADLGGFNRYTWVATAYLVASTAMVPIVGRLTDIYGRKWFYIAGIFIFLGGSALSGLSQTIDQLIAFRALQGIGAGIMMTLAFVAVGDLFAPAERGKYVGFTSAVFGLSSVIGPTLGGFITDSLSWQWIFYINLPLGVPVVALFIRFFPDIRPAPRQHRLDYPGIATLLLAVVPLLLGLSWGGVLYPWGSVQVIAALVIAAIMTLLFIVVELRTAEPILPLSLFRNRVVSISLAAGFLTALGMFGATIFIPLFFQGVLGASATSSGSFLTPMMLGVVVGAALAGQALSRLGGRYRLQGITGLVIMAIGAYLLSGMTVETSYTRAVFNIVVMGFGLGITFPTFTIAVQNAVAHRLIGIATSSIQFFRSIGGAVGLAVLGSVMTNRFHSYLEMTLPPAVRQALPPDQLSQVISNPQSLMNPDGMARLQDTFASLGPQGLALAQQFLLVLRETLALAIGDIFLVSLGAAAIAFLATLFLKEIPLRQRQQRR